jgi:chromosome segregation ATPase
MDKDLGELKITKNMLQQVLDASSDHHRRLRHLDEKTDNIELVVGHVNGGVQRLEDDMDSLHAHGNQLEVSLTNRINRLEGSVNSRFTGVETRLGGVETRLEEVGIRLGGVETRLEEVGIRLGGVDTRLEEVETKLTGLQDGVSAILDRLGPPTADANSGN